MRGDLIDLSRLPLQVSNCGHSNSLRRQKSSGEVFFQCIFCWVEYKVWVMNAINSAVWVCCTDVIHVQHRDTSFTHLLHGVGVEQFNSLQKETFVNILVHLLVRYIPMLKKFHKSLFLLRLESTPSGF